ncbi:MAG: YuzB family protein [Bacillus sp. (in: Bacteria)]|nr:YuzB family protein [Bacillus sp. (in: firmicutes)]
MGIVVVEICCNSLINAIDVEAILEDEYPEVAVIENTCLSFCGMCARSPFAIVNGKRIFAKTPEKCLTLIKEEIEKELAMYR